MTKSDKIKYGIIGFLAIGVIILIIVLFSGKGSNVNQDLIKQIIAAKDSVIASQKDNIALHERIIEEKENSNEILQQRDSILNSHYAETEKIYKDINAKINSIPGRIARISSNNDSLRLLLSTY